MLLLHSCAGSTVESLPLLLNEVPPTSKDSKKRLDHEGVLFYYCHIGEDFAPALALALTPAVAPTPAAALAPAPVEGLALALAPAAVLASGLAVSRFFFSLAPTLASAPAFALTAPYSTCFQGWDDFRGVSRIVF